MKTTAEQLGLSPWWPGTVLDESLFYPNCDACNPGFLRFWSRWFERIRWLFTCCHRNHLLYNNYIKGFSIHFKQSQLSQGDVQQVIDPTGVPRRCWPALLNSVVFACLWAAGYAHHAMRTSAFRSVDASKPQLITNWAQHCNSQQNLITGIWWCLLTGLPPFTVIANYAGKNDSSTWKWLLISASLLQVYLDNVLM